MGNHELYRRYLCRLPLLETFAEDKVLYPFGYGISYTDFKTTTDDVIISDDKITVKTTVANTGEFIYLTKGSHNLEIVFETSGIDLNWLMFQIKQDNVDTSILRAKKQITN